MRNFLLSLNILLALVLANPGFAQDNGSTETAVTQQASEKSDDRDSAGLKVSVNIGDEDVGSEAKLKRSAEKLRRVLGDEISDEIIVEIEGMSKEEKREIADALEHGFDFDSHDFGGSFIGVLVPILAITLSLGMPVIILFLVLVFGHRRRKQKLELVRTYLDSGKDVPAEILSEFDNSSKNSLKSGLTPFAIGLGMIAAAGILDDASELAAIGLIPLFIGIARLLYWKFENKSTEDRS